MHISAPPFIVVDVGIHKIGSFRGFLIINDNSVSGGIVSTPYIGICSGVHCSIAKRPGSSDNLTTVIGYTYYFHLPITPLMESLDLPTIVFCVSSILFFIILFFSCQN